MDRHRVWVSSKSSAEFVRAVKEVVFNTCAVDGRYTPSSIVGTVGAPLGPHGVAVVRGSEEHRALRAAGFSVIPVRQGRSVQHAVEKALSERARAVALLTPPPPGPVPEPPPTPEQVDDGPVARDVAVAWYWRHTHDINVARASSFAFGLLFGLMLGSC